MAGSSKKLFGKPENAAFLDLAQYKIAIRVKRIRDAFETSFQIDAKSIGALISGIELKMEIKRGGCGEVFFLELLIIINIIVHVHLLLWSRFFKN